MNKESTLKEQAVLRLADQLQDGANALVERLEKVHGRLAEAIHRACAKFEPIGNDFTPEDPPSGTIDRAIYNMNGCHWRLSEIEESLDRLEQVI